MLNRRQTLLSGLAGLGGWGGAEAAEIAEPRTAEPAPATVWDPRRFGAVADGQSLDTAAIQAAVDACAAAGGGTVWLAGGVFLSGTIVLRSHVRLHVEAGATLLGSRNSEHYPGFPPEVVFLYRDRFTRSLIYAEGAEQITLSGRGTIDGQGHHFPARPGDDALRPYLIRFSECRNVRVRDLFLRDSARWLSHYLACEDVAIDGVTIHAPIRENRDGIGIDSCDRVRIANCDVYSGDDAIVLKATAPRPCRHVTVTNCTLSSMASALKLGTESNGGFEDITFSNCTIRDTGGSGINLGMVDGGVMNRVSINNIAMRDVGVPIFIRLGNRARPIPDLPEPGMGRLRNVIISNVQAAGADALGCSITGLPGFPVENVTLENVHITFAGGGTAEDAAREVPEREAAYPSQRMFGRLPAYGFYCRHVRNLRLLRVETALADEDERPPLVLEDVEGAVLDDCRGQTTAATRWHVRLVDVRDAAVRHGRPSGPATALLRVEGDRSRDVLVTGNDLTRIEQIVDRGEAVGEEAVALVGNRMP